MIKVTSKDIDTTVKDVKQDTSFIEPSERDNLLPLRELEGLDKQPRTIKGSLKVAIAKRVDLKSHTEKEEQKLNEVKDPKYSDDQRDMIEDRLRKLRAELTERNKEIDILKGEASKQIDQIRESITKFLDKETDTLGERIRTLYTTVKDVKQDTTVKDVKQDTSFIEPSERDNLLPLRELEGLDKQPRTIKGSLKVAIAKRVDLKSHTEKEEQKLNEVKDPKYSDDQRDMIEDRLRKLRAELTERNKEIDILKGEASKQIDQIRESITKFLDKETDTLGERIRTLFKEQGIMIVSILTTIGMTLGVIIEALPGGPSTFTPTSGDTSGGDKKGGAREWIKNKLKALSQLLGKLADKALASLPGIIGSIISWILNRAKEVIGWLSQNLWALITGVGVLIYTYFMTKTRRG